MANKIKSTSIKENPHSTKIVVLEVDREHYELFTKFMDSLPYIKNINPASSQLDYLREALAEHAQQRETMLHNFRAKREKRAKNL